MARFCGEIALPQTPPEEFAAARSTSDKPVARAAVTCSSPNKALVEVSDPVRAVPSQPTTGDIAANARPAPAAHRPRVADPSAITAVVSSP